MLRKLIESRLSPLTDAQFEELMDLTTTDIRINRVAWGSLSSRDYVLWVAECAWRILQRVA